MAEQRLSQAAADGIEALRHAARTGRPTATFAHGATRPGDLLASSIPDEIKAGDVLRLYLVYA